MIRNAISVLEHGCSDGLINYNIILLSYWSTCSCCLTLNNVAWNWSITYLGNQGCKGSKVNSEKDYHNPRLWLRDTACHYKYNNSDWARIDTNYKVQSNFFANLAFRFIFVFLGQSDQGADVFNGKTNYYIVNNS